MKSAVHVAGHAVLEMTAAEGLEIPREPALALCEGEQRPQRLADHFFPFGERMDAEEGTRIRTPVEKERIDRFRDLPLPRGEGLERREECETLRRLETRGRASVCAVVHPASAGSPTIPATNSLLRRSMSRSTI